MADQTIIKEIQPVIQTSLITSFFTLAGGVILLITSEFVKMIMLQPLFKFKEIITSIDVTTLKYYDFIANSWVGTKESQPEEWKRRMIASDELRDLACHLFSSGNNGFVVFLRCDKNLKKKILDARTALIGLSNGILQNNPSENMKKAEKVRSLLRLPPITQNL